MNNEWALKDGRVIELLTPEQLKELPNGVELIDIFGGKFIKGKDEIDGDTRFGYLAYGILNSNKAPKEGM